VKLVLERGWVYRQSNPKHEYEALISNGPVYKKIWLTRRVVENRIQGPELTQDPRILEIAGPPQEWVVDLREFAIAEIALPAIMSRWVERPRPETFEREESGRQRYRDPEYFFDPGNWKMDIRWR
jgi:hypothetical protein